MYNKSDMKKRSLILPIVLLSFTMVISSCNQKGESLLSSVVAPSYYSMNEGYEEPDLPSPSGEVVGEDEIILSEYDYHTAIQTAYLYSSYDKISSFAKGNKELSKPRALTLNTGYDTANKFVLKDNSGDRLMFTGSSGQVDVINLKADTSYICECYLDSNKLGEYTFKTENSLPRNLDVDSVTNVRDLGGYSSLLGGKIRQGLYYRGGRWNYTDEKTTIDQESTFVNELTDQAYDIIVDVLKIKSEIDLRMNESHYQSTYAHEYGMVDNSCYPDVEYCPFPLNWNYSNMMKDEKQTIGNIFKFLAVKENYPVYVHCNIGTDRTGMITYILGTLLGISQLDLYYDYLFSNFGHINNTRDLSKITNVYQKTLLDYKCDNLHNAAFEYLLDCGLEEKEIYSIINIFLDLQVY